MTKLFFDLIQIMHTGITQNNIYYRTIPYVVYEIKTQFKLKSTDDFKKLIKPQFNIKELLLNECECHDELLPCEIADVFLKHHYSTISRILN